MTDGRQLRILFVAGRDLTGPDERQFLSFARELLRQGHRVMMTVRQLSAWETTELPRLPDGLAVRSYGFVLRWPRRADTAAVRAFAPQLIHAVYPRAGVMAAATNWSRSTAAPLFVHFGDDEWTLARTARGRTVRGLIAHAVRRAAAPLAPSLWRYTTSGWLRQAARASARDALTPALAERVEQRLRRPCAVLLPPLPLSGGDSGGQPALELPPGADDTPLVVYTGTISDAHEDDFRLGLRAVALLQRRGVPVRFVHAGRSLPRLEPARLAEEEGLAPGTLLTLGYLDDGRLLQLLRRASVLLQPGEPTEFNRLRLPSKLQEYLASGAPVVTFAAGFGELLEDGREAVLTRSDSPVELADRLAEVLTDSDLRSRLREGGRAAAARLFDPRATTDALVEHYRRHLDGGQDE